MNDKPIAHVTRPPTHISKAPAVANVTDGPLPIEKQMDSMFALIFARLNRLPATDSARTARDRITEGHMWLYRAMKEEEAILARAASEAKAIADTKAAADAKANEEQPAV